MFLGIKVANFSQEVLNPLVLISVCLLYLDDWGLKEVMITSPKRVSHPETINGCQP